MGGVGGVGGVGGLAVCPHQRLIPHPPPGPPGLQGHHFCGYLCVHPRQPLFPHHPSLQGDFLLGCQTVHALARGGELSVHAGLLVGAGAMFGVGQGSLGG